MPEAREVVVVGAGPAGVATAILLRQLGRDVLLLDAARFPRDKVCGESISPAAWPVLERLGAAAAVRELHPQSIRGMTLTAPDGSSFSGAYGGGTRLGFAVSRFDFDRVLVETARRAGVDVREGVRVTDVLKRERRVAGVRCGDEGTDIEARLVVGADGRGSIVARRLGLLREHPRLRKYALRGHWEDASDLGPWGELHVGGGGYCGVAPLSATRANVACVLDQRELRAACGDLEAFYRARLAAWPGVAPRLTGARLEGPPRAIGPLALENRGATAPGALLVGDAAGFFDPFTGEGVTLALRSAEWAVSAAHAALDRRDVSGLEAYEHTRWRATRDKFRLNRLLYQTIARPRLANFVGHRMASRPGLADRLVSLAGDFEPARAGLGLGLAWRLLVG
jgi:menaquinone-9 beta-reductase